MKHVNKVGKKIHIHMKEGKEWKEDIPKIQQRLKW